MYYLLLFMQHFPSSYKKTIAHIQKYLIIPVGSL